ncbi:UNVERIFIED_CONTAM: hypothetical protein Sindi_0789300 [Sesamum indicum]
MGESGVHFSRNYGTRLSPFMSIFVWRLIHSFVPIDEWLRGKDLPMFRLSLIMLQILEALITSGHGHIRILIPILIMWFAWRMRNDAKFNSICFSITRNVCAYLSRLHKAQGMKAKNWKGDLLVAAKLGFFFPKTTPQSPKVIRWRHPIGGWWKLNTDRASKSNSGCAGAGGIIRDCYGRLVLGFADGLGVQTNTYAELYAIARGLQLAKDTGCTQL